MAGTKTIAALRATLTGLCLLAAMPAAQAQGDPEYRAELGAGAGLATYMGDLNGSPLKSMQPALTLMGKYKPNPRMAWTLHLHYTQLKGSTNGRQDYLPQQPAALDSTGVMQPMGQYSFKKGTADVSLGYEYNFWPYGTGREYRGARPLVPFLQAGLGLTISGSTALNSHFGVGVKYKLAQRWNLTALWRIVFTGSDQIDGLKDPYGIKSSGLYKNTDGYSQLSLTVSYDLWAKCKTCHNEHE